MKRLLLAAAGMMLMVGCAQTPTGPGGGHLAQGGPRDQKSEARPLAGERRGMQLPRGPMAGRPGPMHARITLTNGTHVEALGGIRSHSLGGRQFIAFDTANGPMAVRIDQVAVIAGVDPGRLFAGEPGRKEEPQARPQEERRGPGMGMRGGPFGGPFGGRGGPGMGEGRGPGGERGEMRGGPERREMRDGPGPRGEMRREEGRKDRNEEKKGGEKREDKKEEKKEKD